MLATEKSPDVGDEQDEQEVEIVPPDDAPLFCVTMSQRAAIVAVAIAALVALVALFVIVQVLSDLDRPGASALPMMGLLVVAVGVGIVAGLNLRWLRQDPAPVGKQVPVPRPEPRRRAVRESTARESTVRKASVRKWNVRKTRVSEAAPGEPTVSETSPDPEGVEQPAPQAPAVSEWAAPRPAVSEWAPARPAADEHLDEHPGEEHGAAADPVVESEPQAHRETGTETQAGTASTPRRAVALQPIAPRPPSPAPAVDGVGQDDEPADEEPAERPAHPAGPRLRPLTDLKSRNR